MPMRHCTRCDCKIPDHAQNCPRCRQAQPRREWVFQAFLIAVVAATSAGVLFAGR